MKNCFVDNITNQCVGYFFIHKIVAGEILGTSVNGKRTIFYEVATGKAFFKPKDTFHCGKKLFCVIACVCIRVEAAGRRHSLTLSAP